MSRTYSALAAAIACAAAAQPQAASAAGYYFESNTETDGQTMSVRAWVEDEKAKVEFFEGGQGFFQEGGYMLTSDGGQTLYIVDPDEMTYSELDLDQLLAFAGSILNATGGLVQMEFSDLTNERVGEEPGGEILGYDTTRYEFHTAYTMTMGVLGFKRSTSSTSQQEMWCTDEIDAPGFRVWLSPDRFRTGNAELDEFVQAQYQDLDCLPLRSRTTTTMTGERGRDQTTVAVTEVTVLREEASIPASTFELPAGYTSQPFLPEGIEMPADAGAGAQSSEATESAEEERPRLRLRDFLRP